MRHVHLGVLLAIATASFSFTASAINRDASNRCGRSAWDLRGIVSSRASAEEDLKSTTNRLTRVNEVIAATRKNVPEIDENDSSVTECTDLVAKAEKIASYLKGRKEKLEKLRDFFEKHKDAEKTVKLLFNLFHKSQQDKDLINGAEASVVKGWRDTLSTLDAACKTDWPDYEGKLVPVEPLDANPSNWCYVASGSEKLMNILLKRKRWAVEGWGMPLMQIPELLERLPKKPDAGMDAWLSLMVVDDAEYKAAFEKVVNAYLDELGYKSTGLLYEPIAEALAKLRTAIDEAAPKNAFVDTGYHHASLEARAAIALKKIFANATPVRSMMDAPGYTIEKNRLGIPLDRYRSGQILFKMPKTTHCLARTFNYVEEYAGGGTYAPSEVKLLGSTRFTSCK
jgi:hypothetical protein